METDDKDLTLLLLTELQRRIDVTATALTVAEIAEGNNDKAIDELNVRLDRLNQLADTCKALATIDSKGERKTMEELFENLDAAVERAALQEEQERQQEKPEGI